MSGTEHGQPVGGCPTCGKQRYGSRKVARQVARKLFPGHKMSVYQCDGFWHFGHQPTALRRGKISRLDMETHR